MNERIKELYNQSGGLVRMYEGKLTYFPAYQKNVGNGNFEFSSFDPEKFAELIIRECIDKITTYDLVPGHSAKWEDIYDIHARLLQDLGEELKEHFGVTK